MSLLRSVVWILFVAGGLLAWCCRVHGEKALVVEEGTAQLFVDDYLIQSHKQLKRTLHQPVKDHNGNLPIIALESDLGDLTGRLQANGTIVYDPRIKKYVMIATAIANVRRAPDKQQRWKYSRLYRCTSDDGMTWVKGDQGKAQFVFPRSPEDLYDPQSGASATNTDMFSCYFNEADQEYPYQAWQHFSNWGDDREGQYYLRSRDGIHWQRGPMVVNGYGGKDDPSYRRIQQQGRTLVGSGDVTLFYHDPIDDRFLGIFKFYMPQGLKNGNRLRSRAYAFFDHPLKQPVNLARIDHIELLPPAQEVNNDMPYDEYYGSTAWRYESLWLGGLKVWHSQDDYPWSAAGSAFLKLVSSRDGLHWSKVPFHNVDGQPEVFIPNGPEGGNHGQNDGGYLTEFSQGPLRIADELIFYYACSSYGKNHPEGTRLMGGGIFRARLRIDGFVSVDAGSLTTKPLSFLGKNLYLNAVGPVRVDVLDAHGNALASQKVEGDSLRHPVVFQNKSLQVVAHGQPVQLRFTIETGGRLYSFTVRQ